MACARTCACCEGAGAWPCSCMLFSRWRSRSSPCARGGALMRRIAEEQCCGDACHLRHHSTADPVRLPTERARAVKDLSMLMSEWIARRARHWCLTLSLQQPRGCVERTTTPGAHRLSRASTAASISAGRAVKAFAHAHPVSCALTKEKSRPSARRRAPAPQQGIQRRARTLARSTSCSERWLKRMVTSRRGGTSWERRAAAGRAAQGLLVVMVLSVCICVCRLCAPGLPSRAGRRGGGAAWRW